MRISENLPIIRQIALCVVLTAGLLFASASGFGDKRVAVLGDSMSWIGGDSCNIERGWTTYFKKRLNPERMDIYARSGAMWTNAADTRGDTEEYSEMITDENVIYTQALRLLQRVEKDSTARPDIIIVYAGANDAWFSDRRPGMFEKNPYDSICGDVIPAPGECTSLASSVTLTVRLLRDSFPEARIVAVTPVEMSKVSASKVGMTGDIIETAAGAAGVEVLRADHDVEIRHETEKREHRYTTDGVHTNPSGARLIAEYISSRLTDIAK